MDHSDALKKTKKGISEISSREHNLGSRLRALLIVIDGKKSIGVLLDMFGDSVEADISSLIEQGFISIITDLKEQCRELSRMLSNLLGPNADYLNMQIEKCDSVDRLTGLIDDKREMLESALGARGKIFWDKYREVTEQ